MIVGGSVKVGGQVEVKDPHGDLYQAKVLKVKEGRWDPPHSSHIFSALFTS